MRGIAGVRERVDRWRGERRTARAVAIARAGARSVVDQVAPSMLVEEPLALEVDGARSRVLVVSDFPRHVYGNWLGSQLEHGQEMDLSLFVEPLDTAQVARSLRLQAARLQGGRYVDAAHGRVADPEREVAFDDTQRMGTALERGEEQIFSVGAYFRVHEGGGRGRDAEDGEGDLEQGAAQIARSLEAMLAGCRPAALEMRAGVRSCLPLGLDYLGRRRNVDTSTAVSMLPLGASDHANSEGLLFGTSVINGSLVIVDPFSRLRENANKVVLATSGAGKSFACKVEAMRALLLGIHYLVIDPEGEYARLCEAVEGQVVRLAGNSPQRINPFDLRSGSAPPPATEDGRDVLGERVLALLGLLDLMLAERGSSLSQSERGVLDAALYRTYAQVGITADSATHDRQPPLLGDLVMVLREGNDPHQLADRLERYTSGSLGRVFSQPTSATLDRPFVVFDVSRLEQELQPLATYLISDYVWRLVRSSRRPRMLLIDEAWSLVRHPEGARFLGEMARQARKWGLGLTTISQDVRDFLATEHGRIVLANAALKLIMRQEPSAMDAVTEAFDLSPAERRFVLAARRGEGLLVVDGSRVPLRIEASPLEYELASSDPGGGVTG